MGAVGSSVTVGATCSLGSASRSGFSGSGGTGTSGSLGSLVTVVAACSVDSVGKSSVSHGKAAVPSAASRRTCCAVLIHEAIVAVASPGGTFTSNECNSSRGSPSSSMPVIFPGSATSWYSMS